MKRGALHMVMVLALAAFLNLPGLRDLEGLPRAHAQSGGGYDLTWSTVDGGGYMFSTGGGYSLGGTIGQPDAGAMSGGNYALVGGFWALPEYRIYLPVVLRN